MTPDKKRLRIGVLFGGRSGEHEVSLASAASVIRGLDSDKYEVVPIGITKEGHWLIGTSAQKLLPEVLRTGQRVTMSADPTDAALVRLDGSASTSSSPSCTAPSAKTAPFKASSTSPASPSLAQVS
jgi:D-alanine-D-alanine ligase